MKEKFISFLKKAFRKAISLFRIDISTSDLRYQNLTVEGELRKHWSEVGGYIQEAMDQIDSELDESKRLHRDDAQISMKFDEHRKKEDLEHA